MAPRKIRPRRSSREALLDAAVDVLTKNPGAPMATISETAGVGRATLYRYFPTREQLVRELSLEALARTDAAVAPIFAQNLSSEDLLLGMLEAVIPLGDRFHFLANEWSTDADVAAHYQRQMNEMEAFVEQAKSDGVFALEVSTAWIVAAIDALIWAAWASVRDGIVAPRDAAGLAFKTLISGLAPKV